MIISKIFNNNAVLIKDENAGEKIVMGCGIAFKKKCGEELDESKIDKTFILSNPDISNKFQELMTYIPSEYIELGEDIIRYAEKTLGKNLNDSIYISLIDHIYAAIKRFKDGILVKNAILWDIKRFYKDEFNIGLNVLNMIEQRFLVRLPDDEAGFIAIHIVEALLNENVEDMYNITEVMSEISNIVKYNFRISFNEDSIYYYRFITHLKFFAQRLFGNKVNIDDKSDDLLDTVKLKYVNSYECVNKIGEFLKRRYNYNIANEEKLYLTIHIERLVYKSES
ncbi:BglG family transcription antiterminator LicT [Clostridium diolis]|uniref:Transcription antiterminator LicT n=1 Tax=Clostridium diolis TaxID=223919 RepID=A0AAV3W0A8_9CLOT|nr:PRD domain-containing protein [Clostridium diolis]QES71976.1 PRD domain-containing protein [Clostridium diolis]GEA30897.1 transcription antiterminator LicT [Clostridium diolis]